MGPFPYPRAAEASLGGLANGTPGRSRRAAGVPKYRVRVPKYRVSLPKYRVSRFAEQASRVREIPGNAFLFCCRWCTEVLRKRTEAPSKRIEVLSKFYRSAEEESPKHRVSSTEVLRKRISENSCKTREFSAGNAAPFSLGFISLFSSLRKEERVWGETARPTSRKGMGRT
jgi:hypothetical protein